MEPRPRSAPRFECILKNMSFKGCCALPSERRRCTSPPCTYVWWAAGNSVGRYPDAREPVRKMWNAMFTLPSDLWCCPCMIWKLSERLTNRFNQASDALQPSKTPEKLYSSKMYQPQNASSALQLTFHRFLSVSLRRARHPQKPLVWRLCKLYVIPTEIFFFLNRAFMTRCNPTSNQSHERSNYVSPISCQKSD